nr:cytochrome P450 4C1-like isoform X2 [Halyomorpha halys]
MITFYNFLEGVMTYYRFQAKYGHVIRYWLGSKLVILISDADDAEVLFRDTQNIGKADVYKFMHPWLGTGLLTSTGHKWFQRRKAITPTFHFKILNQFIEVFERKSKIFVESLKAKANGQSFDIHPFVSRFSLDVICETAMGTSMDVQINSESEYFKAVRTVTDCIMTRMIKFWLHPDFIYRFSKLSKQHDAALKIVHDFSKKVISEQGRLLDKEQLNNHKDSGTGIKKRTAFLKLLIEMKRNQNEAFTSDDDIREEVDTFMFEGYDTTASAISFAIYEFGRYPHIQEKAYREVSDALIANTAFTIEFLNNLKYLERVIKEVLRLYPSVPMIGREISKDIKLPSGYLIPAGSIATVVIGGIHRNKKYYKKPDQFDPDRFLPENIANRHPYSYVPFSAGSRNCIGQKFAMLEMKASLCHILLNYEIGTTKDPRYGMLLTLQSSNGQNVWLKPRKTA